MAKRSRGRSPTPAGTERFDLRAAAFVNLFNRGAGTRIRTGDLPLTRRLLYQLSYAGVEWNSVLGTDCNGVARTRPQKHAIDFAPMPG